MCREWKTRLGTWISRVSNHIIIPAATNLHHESTPPCVLAFHLTPKSHEKRRFRAQQWHQTGTNRVIFSGLAPPTKLSDGLGGRMSREVMSSARWANGDATAHRSKRAITPALSLVVANCPIPRHPQNTLRKEAHLWFRGLLICHEGYQSVCANSCENVFHGCERSF